MCLSCPSIKFFWLKFKKLLINFEGSMIRRFLIKNKESNSFYHKIVQVQLQCKKVHTISVKTILATISSILADDLVFANIFFFCKASIVLSIHLILIYVTLKIVVTWPKFLQFQQTNSFCQHCYSSVSVFILISVTLELHRLKLFVD